MKPLFPTLPTRFAAVLAALIAPLLMTPVIAFADASVNPASTDPKKASAINANGLQGVAQTRKTSLGVRVSFTIETPTVGQTTEVRLRIEGREIGQSLTVEVATSDGLQLTRGLPGGSATQTDAATEHVVAVLPGSEGVHYVHVFLRAGSTTEALAIAVPVGKTQTLAKPVMPKTMPDGRRILSIPAQQ